jgi:hypothetical protein
VEPRPLSRLNGSSSAAAGCWNYPAALSFRSHRTIADVKVAMPNTPTEAGTSTANPQAGTLATDETDRLIASSKVEGTAVYNRQGERLGTVKNFMVDKRSGQVAYAVMSFGGFLGIGASCHPLPWHVLTYDTQQGGYVVDLDKERLQNAPSYAEGASPNWSDPTWSGRIDAYYADRPDRPRDEAAIDTAVDDTFPASDPPSWNSATGAGAPPKR